MGWTCYEDGEGKATSETDDFLGTESPTERMSSVHLWSGTLQGYVEERYQQGHMVREDFRKKHLEEDD